MRVGILRTDAVKKELVAQFGEYPDMFERLLQAIDPKIEIAAYDVQKEEYPKDLNHSDAYIITGSSSSVYEDKSWIHRLSKFVKHLDLHKKKTIGICFGHQLMAHVLGGKTEKAKSGWHIGTKTHELSDKGRKLMNSTGFNLIFSHSDQVIQPVPNSQILASTSECPIAMCNIGRHILTFQGHPEFEVAYARKLLATRKHIFGEKLFEEAIDSLKLPNHRLEVAGLLIDFIKT